MPETTSPSSTFEGVWNATALTVVICSAITGYNAIEGLILILSTFRQYKGLYFWSLIISTVGCIFYMIGVLLWYFVLANRIVALVILYPGWISMVTGQSVVLYSRLGIVLGSERENILRMVKWMIIIDAIVFHTTTIVIAVCSFYAPNPVPASQAYHYIERLHITAFGVQELIISGLYIWRTLDILRTSVRMHHRRIVYELLIINLILIVIDIVTVTLEYCNLFFFEVAFKMVSYSIKLKLEFAILSKLMLLSGSTDTAADSRGDSLVFPSDTTSTAIDMYRATSIAATHHEPSSHATKHQVDITENGHSPIVGRARSRSVQLEESISEHRDSFDDSYGGIMRALSKG